MGHFASNQNKISVSHTVSHMSCHGNLLTLSPKHLPFALPRLVPMFSRTAKIVQVTLKLRLRKFYNQKEGPWAREKKRRKGGGSVSWTSWVNGNNCDKLLRSFWDINKCLRRQGGGLQTNFLLSQIQSQLSGVKSEYVYLLHFRWLQLALFKRRYKRLWHQEMFWCMLKYFYYWKRKSLHKEYNVLSLDF